MSAGCTLCRFVAALALSACAIDVDLPGPALACGREEVRTFTAPEGSCLILQCQRGDPCWVMRSAETPCSAKAACAVGLPGEELVVVRRVDEIVDADFAEVELERGECPLECL